MRERESGERAGGGGESAEIGWRAEGAGDGSGRSTRTSTTLFLVSVAMISAILAVLLTLPSQSAWQNRPSGIQCARNDVHEPILLVVSMDGFARKYLDLGVTPNIAAMGRNGARAEHVYSVFPSRTFQNHYSIATGLWSESHGIIDNYVLDRAISDRKEDISRTKNPGYFKGDPIWSAYKRERGGLTACLYWIGCGMNVSGYLPDYLPAYNGSASTADRIEMILSWLALEPFQRPNLIMAYMGEPDHTGHFRKNENEIPQIVRTNDMIIDQLMSGIERLGLLDCVNVMLVSDHGMTDLTDHFYWDDYISLEGLIPAYGVVGRIYRNGTDRSDDEITAPFQCSKGEKYLVHSRQTVPVKYHYSSPRVGDFIFEGRPGTTFYATRSEDWFLTGDHGYDPAHKDMRAIFFARGPSIRPGVVLQPFQTVEYYNIFAELLGMRAENMRTNGTLGIVDEMFSRPPPRVTTILTIPRCSSIREIRSCSFSRCNQQNIVRIASRVTECLERNSLSPISSLYFTSIPFCSLKLCEFEILSGQSTAVLEYLTPDSISKAIPLCTYETDDQYCVSPSPSNATILTNLLMTTSDELAGIARAQVPLLSGFVRNFLNHLNIVTAQYVRRYKRVGVITGTVFDSNSDGRPDDRSIRKIMPSHIFRILYTCTNWRSDGLGCVDPLDTNPLSFILPHIERDINCLSFPDYLYSHSARVRDVEEITGLRLFSDPNVIPHEISLKIRGYLPPKLWEI